MSKQKCITVDTV